MDRCTGCHDLTEIVLKTALNTIQSINHIFYVYYFRWLIRTLSHLVVFLDYKSAIEFV